MCSILAMAIGILIIYMYKLDRDDVVVLYLGNIGKFGVKWL